MHVRGKPCRAANDPMAWSQADAICLIGSSGFRDSGFGFRDECSRFRVHSFGFRDSLLIPT